MKFQQHRKTSAVFLSAMLVGSVFLVGQTCNTPSTITDGFVAALVNSQGIIETRFSSNGVQWGASHRHVDIGVVQHGVSLATDTSGALTFLAFFAKDNAGREKLFVREGLVNTFGSELPNQIPFPTASAPAICRLNGRHFFIAWNSGAQSIATALLDTQRSGTADAIRRLQDLNDPRAQDIEGAPSVASVGDRILLIWRRHGSHQAVSFAEAAATFRPQSASVEFDTSVPLPLPQPSDARLSGFPQITTANDRFVLAIGFSDNGAFHYFSSSDGTRWAPFGCASTLPVLSGSVRPHAFAVGNDRRIVHLVAPLRPDSGTSNERGILFANCGDERQWTNTRVFNERGIVELQPAIVFRRGTRQN